MPYIDGHAHLRGTPQEWLETMDRLGIEQAVMVAGGSITPNLLAKQIALGGGQNIDIDNKQLLNQCRHSPRLVPFYFANPHRGGLDYQRDGDKFAGLKWGPALHGVPFSDESYPFMVKLAIKWSHPIYLHCLPHRGFRVNDFLEVAKAYPSANFILGHAGVGQCDFYAVDLIRPYSNIYFETSGGFTSVVRYAVDQLGSFRVIFGTEHPLQDAALELFKANRLQLDLNVMGLNIKRLLGKKAQCVN